MSRLSESLKINLDTIRTRTFDFKGQEFKVRIPKTKEAEEIFKKSESPPSELVDEKYAELTKGIFDRKEEIENSDADIKFLENDVMMGETSLRKLAEAQAGSEIRIVESFKLLVLPNGETLTDITYEEISEDFPKPIQYDLVRKIAEVISPSYEEIRKN
jgi:hypothetical protein